MMQLAQLSSKSLPWPTDWAEVFGVRRPLILEIGFGYGQMLEYLHRVRPEHNIVGIEISNFCLTRMEKIIARHGMYNVRIVRTRAETALHHLFAPASLGEVHVNFPDPWFKERHAGRRLMQPDTLDVIVSRLIPGGKVFLATDILAYAEMSADLLAQTPALTNDFTTPWVNSIQDRVVTKYEQKARSAGRDCYYFAYTRNDQPAPIIPVIEEYPMPHVVIKASLTLEQIYEQAEPHNHSDSERHIEFKYRYQGENNLLFEVYVHEPTIEQRVAVAVVPREGKRGEFTIKLSAIGSPRPTEGLHKAVALLADAICALHPESQILHDKVKR